ncbi:MAG: hypothetical protein U0269_29800 [Polyangiales bacterium]
MIAESVRESFVVAAQELGMFSASALFLREVASRGGSPAIDALRSAIGTEFPVFDAMAERWNARSGLLAVDAALRALRGASRVLVAGFDADPLDALVDGLPSAVRVGLVADVGELCGDLSRTLANYDGRVERVELSAMPLWAGRKSALLAFVYGIDEHETAYTSLAWLRTQGPDVRTQFRSLIGWNLLGAAPSIHPRWVVASSVDEFSEIVGP